MVSKKNIFLLKGVTGSGKTEVYMRMVEEVLEKNQSAIVLVPEISLTPQMIERFKGRFGKNVALFHSKLSDGERFDEWFRVKEGKAKLVVGARSAIFLPVKNLGLIIIDEEHENTYKSDQNPKYQTKEVAEFLSEQKGCRVVLGSATPTIESYYRALIGELDLLELNSRVDGKAMPPMEVIDMRNELRSGNISLFSRELFKEIQEKLSKGEQIILFLNRRGFSTFVSCRSCGYVFKCEECDISMTYHRSGLLVCHYCGKTKRAPQKCPKCDSKYVKFFGAGTQRVEEEVKKYFKDARVLRMDVDTTRSKDSYENIYNTFKERFEGYPIRVEVLSRFKTPKQQKQIIEDAKKGLVDVLIGTHRIISKDINMPNLGLVVIDEEQRFGVKHKESLKKIKSTVDVLTLSATPIPRTLHMSLSGIRDMSVIEEPPQERHPVITYVTEAKESIIQDEIERELGRGGQVFFVYNRVERIEEMASMIQRLVPDAKVAIAHGRMTSKDLENIILGFLNKEFNVLVCTTIIETGMDISNANTMIVYDADKMGLAQLYQLRGRVGRSTRQGYAYLMYEKDKSLSEIAEKRLKAIREFTEFGSGFKIAMRDLEIRGAGNILGSQQHGHMAVIGYDLYVKMLNEAIKKVKGEVVSEDIDVEIDLSVNAYIPDNYITDELIKIEMYKKIASIESKEDMYEVQEELEDRFSDIPKSVETLLKIAYIKTLCKKLKIEKVRQIKDEILLNPLTRYKTKEKIGYNIVNELEELLENMCNLKSN